MFVFKGGHTEKFRGKMLSRLSVHEGCESKTHANPSRFYLIAGIAGTC